jgi:hypothetical protein
MYIRPELDPYGQPWPAASGYLAGFEQSRMEGLTTITVDNGKINSDMLVKLYVRVGPHPAAVRVLFLKAKDRFKMEAITAGPYDLRYQDLDSGVIFRSDPLELTETEEPDGIAYFNRTVSLYTALDGTLRREQIGPEDFR